MGSVVCTVGSKFTGYCEECGCDVTGEIVEGADNYTIEKKPICVTDSKGVGDCGHTCQAVGKSEVWKINGKEVARVGDPVTGTIKGVLTTGEDFVTAD